jgi:hypothetical protein
VPLQNRVTPFGELIAHPARGLVYGNRGCLHDDSGRIRRPWAVRRWISCRLEFGGWHRGPLLQPGKFTELFFLDEATAFAAGHRPCALCRREDYVRFCDLWEQSHGVRLGADAMDVELHAERVDARTRGRRVHRAELDDLPDGAVVVDSDTAWLVVGSTLLRWTPAGYVERRPRGSGTAALLTPPSVVEVLRADWDPVVPLLHPTSGRA